MKAICWTGVNEVRTEQVPDPTILNPRDAIVAVRATTICGSDLHLYDGYIPAMEKGDVLGHEFMGEVVEVGPGVGDALRVGDRVVVPSVIGCGACFFCERELWSLCDNSNPNAAAAEALWGQASCGIFGYSHLTGGYAGSHAEYIRVPFADVGPRRVPDALSDEQALFISDAFPTGYMAADLCDIQPGDVVAVWGAGAVGLFAMRSAQLLGAERVIAIDRFPDRLRHGRDLGCEALDYTGADLVEALKQLTAGRGPDACIDAVGMEAHKGGVQGAYDRVKQALRLESDRPYVLRDMIQACRKGGTLSIVGVYGGLVDKLPMGAAMNKGLTWRMGQMHAHRYLDRLIEHAVNGDVDPAFVATHRFGLDDGPRAYELFKHKADDCLRVVFRP
jgi:threonine dehydrogenase-like Zn-dependent dehydrogenase